MQWQYAKYISQNSEITNAWIHIVQISQVGEDTYREVSNVAHCKCQRNLYHSVIENKPKPQNRRYSESKTNAHTEWGKES